jgi:hypothetical protein
MFLLNINLYADVTTQRAAIEEYMGLIKVSQTLEYIKAQFKPILLALLEKENIPSDKKQIADKYMNKCWDIINTEWVWENIKDQYVEMYMKYFSENEIQEMLQFYKSPTGKKVVELMPQIMKEGTLIGQKLAQNNIMPKIEAQFEEMRKEIKKQD